MSKLLFVFDYDGTLCNTLDAISTSLLATFAELSTAVPSHADIARLIGTGKTLQETIIELRSNADGALDEAELNQWVRAYRRFYAEQGEPKVSLFAGVETTLGSLRRMGALVLLSNKGIDAVEHSLHRFNIRQHFDLVLAEEPDQPQKPDPAVYAKRIAPVFPSIHPKHCIVIGDTASDLEFAHNIGATACFAQYGFGNRAACEAVGYGHAISELGQLIDIYAGAQP